VHTKSLPSVDFGVLVDKDWEVLQVGAMVDLVHELVEVRVV
jgi:hypothetical protein